MPYTEEKLLRMLADVIASRFPISDVELLLQAGANPNGCVTHGLRPMHYAAFAGGDDSYVEMLVQHGADVNCVDDVGYTPLHLAAKAGHVAVLRALIEHGASFDRKEGLAAAGSSGRTHGKKSEGEKTGKDGDGSDSEESDSVKNDSGQNEPAGTIIAEREGGEDDEQEQPVDRQGGDVVEVESTASNLGANQEQDEQATTSTAAARDDDSQRQGDENLQVGLQEVVQELASLEAGQDVGAPNTAVLELTDTGSAAADDDMATRALLADSPLGLAVENEQTACMEILLQNGADPNIKSFLGCLINTTPFDNMECLRLLLRYGADPDALSRGGMTALMRAAKQSQVNSTIIYY